MGSWSKVVVVPMVLVHLRPAPAPRLLSPKYNNSNKPMMTIKWVKESLCRMQGLEKA